MPMIFAEWYGYERHLAEAQLAVFGPGGITRFRNGPSQVDDDVTDRIVDGIHAWLVQLEDLKARIGRSPSSRLGFLPWSS
jgi:hypothetical protein